MEQIKKLLEQVSIINKKNAEILDATGGRFNIFRVCGVNHYENAHSAILAEFLNPNGSHGLKSKLLECFIEAIGSDFIKENFDCTNAHVFREYSTSNGRIDIVIEDRRNHAVIIENKIYAADQKEQIERYAQFAEEKYGTGHYQILYLTLYGKDASEQSSGSIDDYTTASYKESIISWLEQCARIAVHYPMVRETINQYINHLKLLTHQDMDTKNREEIIDMVVGDTQRIESAEYVVGIWDACTVKMLANLENSVAGIANQLGLKYRFDPNDMGEKESSFYFWRETWNYCILFWFEKRHQLYVGVDKILHEKNNEWSDEFKSKLSSHLSGFTIEDYSYVNLNWVWGTKLVAWDELTWAEVPEKMPQIILKTVKVILEKLDTLKE
jgi:hypothetical protein